MDASTTPSPSLSHGDNHDGHEEENRSRSILRRMRTSCSECGHKKRSCDDERSCGRCARSGAQCTYSERRRHGDRAHMQQHQPQGPDRHGVNAKDILLHPTAGALMTSGMLPFKRCRLSASPATGLVGIQESTNLSDFFGCVGFLPLTTPSHTRETMVKIVLPPGSSQQSVFGGASDERGHVFEAVAPGGDLSKISAGNQLPTDLSVCTFWCAVAFGELVMGSPIELVMSYAQVAKEALAKSNSGPVDVEVAKAWVILANLHGFMGDKLNEVATEAELYRYASRSRSALEKAIYTTATEQSASGGNSLCDSEPHGRPDGVNSSLKDFTAADISKTMRALLDDGDLVHLGPLQEAVDRPNIRRGIGAVFIDGAIFMLHGKASAAALKCLSDILGCGAA